MGWQLATIGTALPGGVPLDGRVGRLGLGVLGGEGGLNVVEREVQLILADLPDQRPKCARRSVRRRCAKRSFCVLMRRFSPAIAAFSARAAISIAFKAATSSGRSSGDSIMPRRESLICPATRQHSIRADVDHCAAVGRATRCA